MMALNMVRILNRFYLALCILTVSYGSAQQTDNDPTGNENALIGEWQIDLRPTPDADPYYQVFVVEAAGKSGLTGTFYGSPIEDGYINAVWPELYFAFTTRDATHSYYHIGYLKGGKLLGTSYCPGRNFIARWTGVPLP